MPNQGKLLDKATRQVDENMLKARVADFVNQYGMWDMTKLRQWLPDKVCDCIRALTPPKEMNIEILLPGKEALMVLFQYLVLIWLSLISLTNRILYSPAFGGGKVLRELNCTYGRLLKRLF